MARIPQITRREDVPPDQRGVYDEIAESRGRVGGPFSVLLNSPEVARRVAHLGSYLRFESGLSPAVRELAIMATAHENDCAFEWAGHKRLASEAGVREQAIEVIASGAAPEGLSEDEALVVGYARELFREHRVSDATFQAARTRFGDRGVTELTTTMGYYAMMACTLNAFEV